MMEDENRSPNLDASKTPDQTTAQVYDDVFDSLQADQITRALIGCTQSDGQTLLDMAPELANQPEHKLTAKTDKRLRKAINRELRKTAPRQRLHIRLLWVAALLAVALLAVNASAIRSGISNFYLQLTGESVDITEYATQQDYDTGHKYPLPAYIPPGYSFLEAATYKGATNVTYTNSSGDKIFYTIFEDHTNSRLDNKDADEYAEIAIGSQNVIYIVKADRLTLHWSDTLTHQIAGPAKLSDELVKMAASIINPPDSSGKE